MTLVELGNDLVTNLEALHLLADGLDNTSTIRSGDNVVLMRERVATSSNDQITVVERSTVDCRCS